MSAAPVIVTTHRKLSTLLANPLRRAQVHTTLLLIQGVRALQCTVLSPEGDSELCVFAPRLVDQQLRLTYEPAQAPADGQETRYDLHLDGHRIRLTPHEAHVVAAELEGWLRVEAAAPPVEGDACFVTTERDLQALFASPLRKAQLRGRLLRFAGVLSVEYTMLTPEGDAELIGFGPVPVHRVGLRIGRDRSAADGIPQVARRFLFNDEHRMPLTAREARIVVSELGRDGLSIQSPSTSPDPRSTP